MSNTKIRRILIPVDFSAAGECAIEYGAYLAGKLLGEILLLHIVEGVHTYPEEWFNDGRGSTVKGLIRKKATKKLSEYAGNITKKYGVKVQSLLGTGKSAHKIAETVEEQNIDLIVMGTHGVSGFEEFFVGSTAHKVVNLSPCPVVTIRQGFSASAIKTIILPIDESMHSRQKVNYILPIALSCNSVVHILGIIQGGGKSEIAKFNIKINSVEKAVKKAGLVFIRKIVKGKNIAVEAMNYADKANAEMLAIMTDHESNMGKFMGGFAHQIVNHSKVPVLSIRPDKSTYDYPV